MLLRLLLLLLLWYILPLVCRWPVCMLPVVLQVLLLLLLLLLLPFGASLPLLRLAVLLACIPRGPLLLLLLPRAPLRSWVAVGIRSSAFGLWFMMQKILFVLLINARVVIKHQII